VNLLDILVGLLTAAFLIHLRGAYVLAHKQQSAITRLHSYLMYWRSWVLDNDAFSIFYLGIEWNKEAKERLAKGEGAASLVALKEEKKKKLDEIRAELEKDSPSFDTTKLKQQLAKLPTNSIDHILRHNELFEQNLLDGKTFLTDDDASALGPYYARLCVHLKMNLIAVGSKVITLVISLIGSPESFSVKDSAKELAEIVWKGVLVSKDMDELFEAVERARNKSLVRLTWNNLWL
jgi:hypothetical protein